MLYSNVDIREGERHPDAWLWHGKVIPFSKSAPIGWAMVLKLPWFIRRHSRYNGKYMTHQLVFVVSRYIGPERYEFYFRPLEDTI